MAFATWTPPRPPQLGTSKQIDQAVDAVKFGDGYEQASAAGLNSLRETWNLQWNGCTNADCDTIEAFWRSKGKATPFWYKPPGAAAPLKFRFESFRRGQIAGPVDSIDITLRQVFDQET